MKYCKTQNKIIEAGKGGIEPASLGLKPGILAIELFPRWKLLIESDFL